MLARFKKSLKEELKNLHIFVKNVKYYYIAKMLFIMFKTIVLIVHRLKENDISLDFGSDC